jgi:hypothetical protein
MQAVAESGEIKQLEWSQNRAEHEEGLTGNRSALLSIWI